MTCRSTVRARAGGGGPGRSSEPARPPVFCDRRWIWRRLLSGHRGCGLGSSPGSPEDPVARSHLFLSHLSHLATRGLSQGEVRRPASSKGGPRSSQLLNFQMPSPLPTMPLGTWVWPFLLTDLPPSGPSGSCPLVVLKLRCPSACCPGPLSFPVCLLQLSPQASAFAASAPHLPHACPTLYSGYFQVPESASWIKAMGIFPLPHPWPLLGLFPG